MNPLFSKKIFSLLLFTFFSVNLIASYLLIPMDEDQKDHLKSYGIAYWLLQEELEVDWLLNYRGGSFAVKNLKQIEKECKIRGVSYEVIADARYTTILNTIANPEKNMDLAKLEKEPKIAVYSPKSKLPWDDAVTMALTYAGIPYEIVYDEEVLEHKLVEYDWLHLHHEDFTGQYGKFYRSYRNASWYKQQQQETETRAKKYGFDKASKMKLKVAQNIRDFVAGGGFMFAMCSATDSYDIALAAEGTDICGPMFDGDAAHSHAQAALDFTKTFAFKDFKLRENPLEYEYSNIDANFGRKVPKNLDYFTLFDFSAKWDPVPTMLAQCHTRTVKGFMGQTTSLENLLLKQMF